MAWNIENLIHKVTDPLTQEYLGQFDVFGCVETWLKSEEDAPVIPGFSVVKSICTKRRGSRGRHPGGITVYVKQDIRDSVRPIEFSEHVGWVEIKSAGLCVVVGFVYNQPQDSPYSDPELLDKIQDDVLRFADLTSYVFILGDFNARTGELDDRALTGGRSNLLQIPDFIADEVEVQARSSQDKEVNTYGKKLVQFCIETSFCLLNGRTMGDLKGEYTCYTQNGKSVVDYGVSSVDALGLVQSFVVGMTTESHHMPLELSLSVPLVRPAKADEVPRPVSTNEGPQQMLPKFRWNDDLAAFVRDKCQVYLHFLMSLLSMFGTPLSGMTMEGMVKQTTAWFSMVFHCMRVRANRGDQRGTRTQHQWQKTRQEALRLLRRFRRTGRADAVQGYLVKKATYKEEKKEWLERKREERTLGVRSLYYERDWRQLWKRIRAYTKPFSSLPREISPDDWRQYFRELYNVPADRARDEEWDVDVESLPDVPELDRQITGAEVRQTLKKMNLNKAPGLDGIPTDFYKNLANILSAPLAKLFNLILSSGIYPAAWSMAVIQPLYKNKGSKTEPNNYRGIALLNSISKIFTKILNNRLYKWLEANGKITEFQAGFRPGYSAVDQVFILKTLIDNQRDRKGSLYVAFVDFTKAFDCVVRSALWFKLASLGVSRQFIKVLQSMYRSARFCVRTGGGSISEEASSETGVMQGEQLSPLLFSVFISDIPELVSSPDIHAPCLLGDKEVPCLFYADDDASVSISPVGLQRHLDRMDNYCEAWGMKVNVTKTKIMVYGNKRSDRKYRWLYAGEQVEVVRQFKYLGFMMSENGKWDAHIRNVCNQAYRLMPSLYKFIAAHPNIPITLCLHLFDSLIVPVLLYGCELWAWSGRGEKVDKVARQFYKRILRVPSSASNTGVELLLGRVSLSAVAKVRAFKYLTRLLSLPDDRLVKKALQHQVEKILRGVPCWLSEAKREVDRQGFNYVWHEGHENTGRLINEFRQRVFDGAFQDQLAKASIMRSISEYSEHKISREVDRCLLSSQDSHVRRVYALIMLKCPGSYVVWLNPGKKCSACDTKISNIFVHRILQCPRNALRRRTMKHARWFIKLSRAPEFQKFQLLQRYVKDPGIMKEVASFF